MAIDIPGILYTVIFTIIGGKGSPWYEIIFQHALPMILIFLTIYDLTGLMPFRKLTRNVIAAVFALASEHIGIYSSYVEMMRIMLGTGDEGTGLWLPMFTAVIFLGLMWYVIGQFVMGFRLASTALKNIDEMTHGAKTLNTVGTSMTKAGEKRDR